MPAVLTPASLEQAGGQWRLSLDDNAWWSGDRVRLTAPAGIPLDLNGDGYADNPTGHRMYGPEPVAGPTTLHREFDMGPMYRGNNEKFYEDSETTGLTTEAVVYLRRDQLDRATFYSSEFGAINGSTAGLLPLAPVVFGELTVTADWSEDDGWRQVCNMQAFAIDTDPSNLDTAAIGEEFGSYVRGMVRGAGSFTGQMSNKYCETTTNTARLAKLALLTRKGAIAKARFQLSPGDDRRGLDPNRHCDIPPEPPLYYEVDILLGQTSVRLDVLELTTIEAQFVITGEPRLIMDYDDLDLPGPPPGEIQLESGGFLMLESGGFIKLEA